MVRVVNVQIVCLNASFGETDDEKRVELSRILAALAVKVATEGIDDSRLIDCNGNKVGSVTVS
jgi:hypothetical protein